MFQKDSTHVRQVRRTNTTRCNCVRARRRQLCLAIVWYESYELYMRMCVCVYVTLIFIPHMQWLLRFMCFLTADELREMGDETMKKKCYLKSEMSAYMIFQFHLAQFIDIFIMHTTYDVSIFSAIVAVVVVVVLLSFLPITRSVSIRAYRQHRQACAFTRSNEQDIDAVERVHVMLLIYLKWTRNRIMLQLLQINESHSNLQLDVIVCTSIRYLRCDSLEPLW